MNTYRISADIDVCDIEIKESVQLSTLKKEKYPNKMARRKVNAGIRLSRAETIVGVVYFSPIQNVYWFAVTLYVHTRKMILINHISYWLT